MSRKRNEHLFKSVEYCTSHNPQKAKRILSVLCVVKALVVVNIPQIHIQ